MLRPALALLLLLAATPATASAAAFGERPFQRVSPVARCLRATGAPGELARWAPNGVELIQATPSGFGASTDVVLGETEEDCPVAAAQPDGAGVFVARLYDGIGVGFRAPGGGWARRARIPLAPYHSADAVAAAVSPRGDAVVAWEETQPLRPEIGSRIRVARRAPGGPLGAPVDLAPLQGIDGRYPEIEVGMEADGTVVALWTQDNRLREYVSLAFAAVAPPGKPFGPRQLLAQEVEGLPSLAVASDGRALAVLPETRRTLVLERSPHGAFRLVDSLGAADSDDDGRPAVALRPDGAAIVAWKASYSLRVLSVRRDGPGRFGRRERAGAAAANPYGAPLALDVDAPSDREGRAVQAAFAGDGRPVLTWAGTRTLGTLDWAGAAGTTFRGPVQVLGGPLRDADSVTPVILAGGAPAVAWSDVAETGDAHLHLAPRGAAAAPARGPFPLVRLGRARQAPHALVLPVACSAGCDVRASVPGGASGTLTLPRGGVGRLRIDAQDEPIELQRSDSARIQVLTGPPGARTVRTRVVTARLRAADPPLPRILGLKAVRVRRSIVVSWRTDRAVRGADLLAQVTRTRSPHSVIDGDTLTGGGRRSFRLHLRGATARYVQLYVDTHRDATERRVARVRVATG